MVLAFFCIAFLLSLGLTRVALYYAVRRGMVDRPNDRSSHNLPTPRGGGFAIVLVFLGLSLWLMQKGALSSNFFLALVGGGFVALIGFWDDLGHVPAGWRLLVHGAAATWSVVWIGNLPELTFGHMICGWTWWGVPFAVLFVMWLTNLYNFMDGIDGIAGVQAVSVTLSAALIFCYGDAHVKGLSVVVILAGAVLGFLMWNWPPAQIFLGDVGSGFLGFILGVFALYWPMQSRMNFWSWLILLGVFIVDATVTLLIRALRGEALHMAHRTHAYQHLARRCCSHLPVTLGVLAINMLWLFPLALAATLYPFHGVWLVGVALAPLVICCVLAGAGKEFVGGQGHVA